MGSYSRSIVADQIAGSICLLISVLVFPTVALAQERSQSLNGNSALQSSEALPKESGSKGLVDSQLKQIIDQMAAVSVLHPTTLEQAEKAYLFYTRFSGPPEQVFR